MGKKKRPSGKETPRVITEKPFDSAEWMRYGVPTYGGKPMEPLLPSREEYIAEYEARKRRFRGALVGLATGDALGTSVEFMAPGSFDPVTDMRGGGVFGLEPGQWTDDTSMALCLADSLIEKGTFDQVDQLTRYVRWWREGHNSSTGTCFDIGGSTSRALSRFERTGEEYPGLLDPNGGGNAPLMRLAPIPMAFADHPGWVGSIAGWSAKTTHGAPEAIDAARYLAVMIVAALNGADKDEILSTSVDSGKGTPFYLRPLHPKVVVVAEGSYREKEPPDIKGGGYSVESLEAALWAFHGTESWEAGALAAVNLGDDADTTAAIYGQLAGAHYGIDAIPEEWRNQLAMGDEIVARADALYELAGKTSNADAHEAALRANPRTQEDTEAYESDTTSVTFIQRRAR